MSSHVTLTQCNMKGWSNKGTVFERPRMHFYNLKWTFACKLLHVQVEFAGTWSFAVADLRWARGKPPLVQILLISCSFWEILAKSYVAPPTPQRVGVPTSGKSWIRHCFAHHGKQKFGQGWPSGGRVTMNFFLFISLNLSVHWLIQSFPEGVSIPEARVSTYYLANLFFFKNYMKVENDRNWVRTSPGSANVVMITMFLASLLASRELRVGGIRFVSFTVSSQVLNTAKLTSKRMDDFGSCTLCESRSIYLYHSFMDIFIGCCFYQSVRAIFLERN